MSKRNMLLGLAAGKVGDLVFYRDGGEQRTRTRVIPKNPRSRKQMEQRVKLANVSSFYRNLKSVIAESFTSRPSNQSGYNAFARYAINESPYLTKEQALKSVSFPAPYMVSKGVLSAPIYDMGSFAEVARLEVEVPSLVADGATIGKVSSALLSAYPFLQNGDVLTFICQGYFTDDAEGVEPMSVAGTSVISLKIDTSSTSNLMPSGLIIEDDVLVVNAPLELGAAAGAVIVSRTDGSGILQSSTSRMVLSGLADDYYTSMRSDNALYSAIESYGVGEQSILRD